MAEFYFKQQVPGQRILRHNSDATTMSSNKNGEFKVPKVPSRYVTQTFSDAHTQRINQEISALQCLKPIGDKFEVIDKLKLIPYEEIKQISAEFVQKLDSICMAKITQQLLQPNPKAAPSVINDNGSVIHSLMSHAPSGQPSVRSCICQGSTCGSEIAYSVPKEISVKESTLKAIPERQKRIKQKSAAVSVPNNEDDSIVSLFKTNRNEGQNIKNGKKKFASSVVTSNTVDKPAVASHAKMRNSRMDSSPRSHSVTRPRSKATRTSQARTKSVIPNASSITSDESEIMDTALRNRVTVVINQAKNVDNNKKRKTRVDTSAEPKKRRVQKTMKEDDDINITKDSLRKCPDESQKKNKKKSVNETTKNKQTNKKKAETKENVPLNDLSEENRNICGYDQTDQEIFGDVSTIINDSTQVGGSPSTMKNLTKMSSNKNDQLAHLFSPFSNIRSTSGVSAISTPLSKTLPKATINKRLKKPDVASELKAPKSRPAIKRPFKNDIMTSLENSQKSEFETSDFSDTE